MINTFIPSRNRACQLHLLLESLEKNAKGIFRPFVYWRADNQKFLEGYRLLAEKFPKVSFIQENDIIKQFYTFIKTSQNYFSLFMDDCIFYKNFETSFDELLTDDTWCLSLRLGLNTVLHDYKSQQEMKPINITKNCGNYIKYRWDDYSPLENYGFIFSWDGVVYHCEKVLQFFKNTDFIKDVSNPNSIPFQRVENYTQNRRNCISVYPLICIPRHSNVICLNTNSTHAGARFGNESTSLEVMNDKYLNGKIVNFDELDFSEIKSCHTELELKWKNV